MKNDKIPGGFEKKLSEQLLREEDEDKISFKSVDLTAGCHSRDETTSFSDIRMKILDMLTEF